MITINQFSLDLLNTGEKVTEFIRIAIKSTELNSVVIDVSGEFDLATVLAASVRSQGAENVAMLTSRSVISHQTSTRRM